MFTDEAIEEIINHPLFEEKLKKVLTEFELKQAKSVSFLTDYIDETLSNIQENVEEDTSRYILGDDLLKKDNPVFKLNKRIDGNPLGLTLIHIQEKDGYYIPVLLARRNSLKSYFIDAQSFERGLQALTLFSGLRKNSSIRNYDSLMVNKYNEAIERGYKFSNQLVFKEEDTEFWLHKITDDNELAVSDALILAALNDDDNRKLVKIMSEIN
jgi:hypothetical protein